MRYDSTIYKKLGQPTLNGRPVELYEVVYTKSSTVDGKVIPWETSKRIWVNNDGIIVRIVEKSGNHEQPQKIRSWLYDYEARIVITAPKL